MTTAATIATLPVAAPVEEKPSSTKRRSKIGRLLMIGLAFAAVSGLLGQIGSFGDVVAALGRAEWAWVLAAVLCAAATYPTSALGIRAGLGVPASLGSVTALQLSSKFANLVTPAGLGSTALNVKFMKRKGVAPASAVTADVATGVVSGVAEVLLAGVCLLAARRDFRFGELPAGTGRVVLLAVLAIGVVVAIALRIPKIRAAAMPHLRQAWATIVGLAKSPRRTALVAASAVVVSVLFALCLGLSVRAYGYDVPLATLVLVNWGAATLGSIAPVPGGLGVAEAGLVAGLTAAGVPADIAVAAALTHRLITFWLPPVVGWFALRHLRRHELV
jgi:undecaprenyl-diphosphatase